MRDRSRGRGRERSCERRRETERGSLIFKREREGRGGRDCERELEEQGEIVRARER